MFARRTQKAFTLVELIVVTVLIGILATVAIVRYMNVVERSRSAEAYSTLADIVSAESAYYTEYDVYTTTWTALDRYNVAPTGQNFDFSTALANVSSGYVKAIHIAGKGSTDYYMCINGGTKGTSVPTCP